MISDQNQIPLVAIVHQTSSDDEIRARPSSHDRPNQTPLYQNVNQTGFDAANSLGTKTAKTTENEGYQDINASAQDVFSESFMNCKKNTSKSEPKSRGASNIYEDVDLPAGNHASITCEDVELPAQDELGEFSMNAHAVNIPRSEVMHNQDSNKRPGQLPFYAIVWPSNSSDENVSDNGKQESAGYDDVYSTSRHNALPIYSHVKKANKKPQANAVNLSSNASYSSELVDNIIYVSSGPED